MPSSSSLSPYADAALATPLLARACLLAAWIGDKRELTASGVLRPAVAVEACRELGIELPSGGKLRSAMDVTELQRTWEVAVAAGLVEITGNRVSAAGDAAALAAAAQGHVPSALAERVVGAWLSGAALPLGIPEDPCMQCLTVLHELGRAGGMATETGHLTDAVLESMADPPAANGSPLLHDEELYDEDLYDAEPYDEEDEYEVTCPHCGQDHPTDLPGSLAEFAGLTQEDEAAEHTVNAVESLAYVGAAVTGPGNTPGGTVTLTPLGQLLADQVMLGLTPDPAAEASEVAERLAPLPAKLMHAAVGPWLSARTPEGAVTELLSSAEHADGGQRQAALALAMELGDAGRAAWRPFARKPGFGAYARQWLSEQGEPVEVHDNDDAWLLVDSMVLAAQVSSPELVAATFGGALGSMPEEEADDVIAAIQESGHPAAAEMAKLMSARPRVSALNSLAAMLSGSPSALFGDDDDDYPGEYGNDVPEGTRYQLKVTLNGVSKPPVWRRVVVPASIALGELSEVILAAMGWHGGHLHAFSDGLAEFGAPDEDLGHADEDDFELADLVDTVGDRLVYTYDFGDDWEHLVKLEKVIEPGAAGAEDPAPTCLAGKGKCPPEDCGGTWGYAELKQALADPAHEDHEELMEWLGLDDPAGFDPAHFSPDEANARLRSL